MGSISPKILGLRLLSLVLVCVLTPPTARYVYCNPSVADEVSAQTPPSTAGSSRGIRAALLHKDHYSVTSLTKGVNKTQSPRESLLDDARRSLKRAERLHSRSKSERRVAEDVSYSSRASQPVDWESPLSDVAGYEYLMEISLGTPPQTFVAVADTGSDLTWVQCLPREDFFNQSDPPFDPSKSSTYANISCNSASCEFLYELAPGQCAYSPLALEGSRCDYYYYYGDGSLTNGTLAEDTIPIDTVEGGVQSVPQFWFGCSHNATSPSSLYDAADGLVGLGAGDISFPSQLGQYYGSVFSYCLVNRSRRAVESSLLIFGDDAWSETTANGSLLQFQFTPLINNSITTFYESFYFVNVEAIDVNGVAVNIPIEAFSIAADGSGGTFFDSGTTYTSLVDKAFDPLLDATKSAITDYNPGTSLYPDIFELCYEATWDDWISEYGEKVPRLSFHFANASSYDLGVEGSWVEMPEESLVCLAILRGSDSNVFGNVQQVDFRIVYDLESTDWLCSRRLRRKPVMYYTV